MKSGTTKNYISRVENDASYIRLSTLMRIIREGLGGQLILNGQLDGREYGEINPVPSKVRSRA